MNKKRIFFVDNLNSVQAKELTANTTYNGTIFFTNNGEGHGDIYKDGILYTYICGVNDEKNTLSTDGGKVILSYSSDSHYLQMYSYNIFPDTINITYSSCDPVYNYAYAYLLLSDDRYAEYNYQWSKTKSNVTLSQTGIKNLCKIYVKTCTDNFTDNIKCTLSYNSSTPPIKHVATAKLNVEYNKLAGLYLYPEELYIRKSDLNFQYTKQLNIEYTPYDTNDKKVTFVKLDSDDNVISDDNTVSITNTGLVKGQNEGYIFAYAQSITDSTIKSNTVKIHVTPTVEAKKLSVNVVERYSNTIGNQTNDSNNTTYLKTTFYPTSATNKTRTWKVLNTSLCKIKGYGTSVQDTDNHSVSVTTCQVDDISSDYLKIQSVANQTGTTLVVCEHLDESGNKLYDYVQISVVDSEIRAVLSGLVKMHEYNGTNMGGTTITQVTSGPDTFVTFTCNYTPSNATFVDNTTTYLMLKNQTNTSSIFTTVSDSTITNDTKLPVSLDRSGLYTHIKVKDGLQTQYTFDAEFHGVASDDSPTILRKTSLIVKPKTFDSGDLTINTNSTLYAGCIFTMTITSSSFINVWDDVYENLLTDSDNIFNFANSEHSVNSTGKILTITNVKVKEDTISGTYRLCTHINGTNSQICEYDVMIADIELSLSRNEFLEQTNYNNITITSSVNNVFSSYAKSSTINGIDISGNKISISSAAHDSDEEIDFDVTCTYKSSGNITGGTIIKRVKLYFYRVNPVINIIEQQLDITPGSAHFTLKYSFNVSTANDIGQNSLTATWYDNGTPKGTSQTYTCNSTETGTHTIKVEWGTISGHKRTEQQDFTFTESYVYAERISIATNGEPTDLYINSTDKTTTSMIVEVDPQNHSGHVTWSSTPSNIVYSVEQEKKKTITTTNPSGSYQLSASIDSCQISRTFNIYEIRLNNIIVKKGGSTITITQSTKIFRNAGFTYQLVPSRDILLNGNVVTGNHGYSTYSWSSSNTSIAKINNDGTLNFTGCNGTGKVTFTCTLANTTLSKTIDLNIENATITLKHGTNVITDTQTLYTNGSPKTYDITVETNLNETLSVSTSEPGKITVSPTSNITNGSTITCTAVANGTVRLNVNFGTRVSAYVDFDVKTLITQINFTVTSENKSMTFSDTSKNIDLFTNCDFTVNYEILPTNATNKNVAPQITKSSNNITGTHPNYHTSPTYKSNEYIEYEFTDVNGATKTYTLNIGIVDFSIKNNSTDVTGKTYSETYNSGNNKGKSLTIETYGSCSSNSLVYQWKLNNNNVSSTNEYDYKYKTSTDTIECTVTTNLGLTRTKFVKYNVSMTNILITTRYVVYGISLTDGDTFILRGTGFNLSLYNNEIKILTGYTVNDNAGGLIFCTGTNGGHDNSIHDFNIEFTDNLLSQTTGVSLIEAIHYCRDLYKQEGNQYFYKISGNQQQIIYRSGNDYFTPFAFLSKHEYRVTSTIPFKPEFDNIVFDVDTKVGEYGIEFSDSETGNNKVYSVVDNITDSSNPQLYYTVTGNIDAGFEVTMCIYYTENFDGNITLSDVTYSQYGINGNHNPNPGTDPEPDPNNESSQYIQSIELIDNKKLKITFTEPVEMTSAKCAFHNEEFEYIVLNNAQNWEVDTSAHFNNPQIVENECQIRIEFYVGGNSSTIYKYDVDTKDFN